MGLSILALLLLTLIVMALGKVQTVKHSSIKSDKQLLIPVLAIGLILAVCVYLHNDAAAFRGTTDTPVPPLQQFKAQGFLGIISLFFANALWMIVDISTWQRIASVKQEGGEFPLASLRSGTLRVLFESPASWLLGIVLGWSIRALGVLPPGTDPSEGLSSFASALARGTFQLAPPLTLLTPAIYPVLIYATVSIMLSTVNALASTISFTAYSDLPPYRDFGSVDANDRVSLRHARIWTAVFVVIGLILYPLIRHVAGTSLPTFLYLAYSAQLSLFPIAFLSLLRRNLDFRAALVSLWSGLLMTFIGGFIANKISDPSAAVLPPLFAVTFAAVAYVFAYRPPRLSPEVNLNEESKG
jgi:hypothetical protein